MGGGTHPTRSATERWGGNSALFSEGFLSVPNRFLRRYASLKPPLTPGEALFVLQLMTFKWERAAPFPAYKRIAKAMGVTDKMARRYAQGLQKKGYLIRQFQERAPNKFDLTGLFEALAEISGHKSEERIMDEDRVTLQFQNQVRLVWRRTPEFRVRVQCAAVERGPLVFALSVRENWRPFVAPAHGPGQDAESCRLFPKDGAAWNYALVIDREHPEQSLSLRKLPVPEDAQPFGPHPPVGLEVKARRVLNWKMEGDAEHPKTPGSHSTP
jgi:hypothetical protein